VQLRALADNIFVTGGISLISIVVSLTCTAQLYSAGSLPLPTLLSYKYFCRIREK